VSLTTLFLVIKHIFFLFYFIVYFAFRQVFCYLFFQFLLLRKKKNHFFTNSSQKNNIFNAIDCYTLCIEKPNRSHTSLFYLPGKNLHRNSKSVRSPVRSCLFCRVPAPILCLKIEFFLISKPQFLDSRSNFHIVIRVFRHRYCAIRR